MAEIRTMPRNFGSVHRVAIIGASTLKGRELKETLEEGNFAAASVDLLDDDESLGTIDQVGEEATFIQSVDPAKLRKADIVFFASDADFTRKHWKTAADAGCAIVDLSYAEECSIPVRSPWLARELESDGPVDLTASSAVICHPAATMLGLLLLRAQKAGKLRSAAATIFEPVSELGKRGMDELHQQTVNLLSFQNMPKQVYDLQIAFNLVSRYGPEASAKLSEVEERIGRHLRHVAGNNVQMPAIQLLQAPIFHAYTCSLCVEFEDATEEAKLAYALEGPHVVMAPAEEDGPSNVSAAGQDSIVVSLRRDAQRPDVIWLWAAADNLKLAAVTAVELAQQLAATRTTGKIQ